MTTRVEKWLPEPPGRELTAALARLARAKDVGHVAVMPDAHLSEDVCVGVVTATRRRIFPAAVGGDIGCGMAALRFSCEARRLADRASAARVLAGLYHAVPPMRRARAEASPLPEELAAAKLYAPGLEAMKEREARLELGTLGRGNHFLELQRDDEGALWLMVHSGSRAMGPAIRARHEARALRDPTGLAWLDAESEAGRDYLADAAWAERYARLNRRVMVDAVVALLGDLFGVEADRGSFIECDHNHVRRETHGGELLWVHRKGAMRAAEGEPGIIPGSMGSASFHVEGRGHPAALASSAHGAGRAMSRSEARRRVGLRQLEQEVSGVWFDQRLAHRLREEAPSAYKDIGAVMRAQRELVRIARRLEPVLVYKGV